MNYIELPVYRHKELILKALETSQAIVVESPTGSGKTTQLPVILYDSGYGKNGIIGVTQPRRIAALSVSEFIAKQMGTRLGGIAGYKMRFEDKTSRETKIKIMTDGILLQEMKLDPWLSKYNCLVVDEAHERSLNIDFILGLLKRVLEERKDFKVIVSSATINAEVFSEYFGECPIVKIDAVTYPVTLIYDPPPAASPEFRFADELLLEKINSIVERIADEKREGHILIFLPGERSIKDCMARLAQGKAASGIHLIPLYGRLGKEEQEKVFDDPPKGKIKVIVSTNIAETSVTIEGITAVIDSGLSKLNYYNPQAFTSSLVEAPVSKASANQRKGRAGRTGEGSCYRLYSRRDFEKRPLFTTEEIYRTDLSEVVLRMADLGLTSFEEFDFISPPGKEGIIAAIETLKLLDALEDDRTLSNTGKLMLEFPLAPRHSRIIVEAILKHPQVIKEAVVAAAFLSTQSPYVLPLGEELDARKAHHSFRDEQGDFVSYLKLLASYMSAANRQRFCEESYLDEKAMAEIANVTQQLEEIVSQMKIPLLSGGPVDDYLCCVARGLIQFVCVREGGFSGNRKKVSHALYRSLTADRILIHPGSVMFRMDPQYIVAGEIVKTNRTYAMSVSPLSRRILERLDPDLLHALGDVSPERDIVEGRRKSGRRGAAEKLKTARDFTNNIKIGDQIFAIETVKGKKQVKLPWENLAKVKNNIGSETASFYRRLKGVITVNDEYTLLEGERLSLILTLAPSLDPERAWNRKLNPKAKFNSNTNENLDELLEQLPLLAKEAPYKAKDKKGGRKTRSRKELGFITLFTNGNGYYWLKCSKRFHSSLSESLSSVETLIDELGEEIDVVKKHIVNQTFRRLSDLM